MAKIGVDSEKCCGCRICEMACSMTHVGVFNPRRGLIRVEINRLPQLGVPPSQIDIPVVCLQCDPAPCSEACPEGAIVKSDVGAWVIDKERCIRCGLCVDACSYGMITLDARENEYARKCDLCQGSPLCVEYCPTQALTF